MVSHTSFYKYINHYILGSIMNNGTADGYEYEIIWEKDYDGGGNMGVAIDSKNNVIACGINKSEDKGIVVKYDENGEEKWSNQDLPNFYAMPLAKDSSMPSGIKELLRDYGYFFDIAVDSKDNIIVAGTFTAGDGKRSVMYVKKYDSQGNEIWERTYTPFLVNLASGVAIDDNDDIIIAGGGTMTALSFKGCIIKISGENGRMIWKRLRRRRGIVLYTSVVTNANDIIALGFSRYDDNLDLIVTKFGGRLGLRKNELIRWGNKVGMKIVMNKQNNFIVVGKTEKEEEHYLLKFDSNFNILWEKGKTKGFLYGVSVMKNGEIVASGFKEGINEYYAALYNKDGEKLLDMLLGERVSNLPDDYMRGIAIDGNNDMVITGARTVGKTMKVRIKYAEEPSPPSPPSPSAPTHEHPKESWLHRLLRWLFGI